MSESRKNQDQDQERKEELIEVPQDRLEQSKETQPKKAPADLLDQLLEVNEKLNAAKELYQTYDHLVTELRALGFTHCHYRGKDITLVDNFADKNTAFKAAFIKRFEVKVKDLKEDKGKKEKEAKK